MSEGNRGVSRRAGVAGMCETKGLSEEILAIIEKQGSYLLDRYWSRVRNRPSWLSVLCVL